MNKRAWGKRREPGVMNKLEQQHAAALDADPDVVEWWFERLKWKLADNTYWTPDFLVILTTGELRIDEVKGGLFPEHNRVKLKVAADSIPIPIRLCQFKNKQTGWVFTDV